MTQEIIEQVSSLMDGELPDDQMRFLLRRFDADPALAQRWARYHLVRACLRRESDSALAPDLAQAVMARLAQESEPAMRPAARGWLHWVGGGAVAAAVAVAALLVSRPVADGALAPAAAMVAATSATTPKSADDVIRLPASDTPIIVAPAYDYTQPARFQYDKPLYSVPHFLDAAPVRQGPLVLRAQDRGPDAAAAQRN